MDRGYSPEGRRDGSCLCLVACSNFLGLWVNMAFDEIKRHPKFLSDHMATHGLSYWWKDVFFFKDGGIWY